MDAREDRVDAVIAEYLAACDAGTPPERNAFLARYPDLAQTLGAFVDDHERMRRADDPSATVGPTANQDLLGNIRDLGEYELLAEIARGGIGYQARHAMVYQSRPLT